MLSLISSFEIDKQMSYNTGLFCKMERIYWRIKEIDELRARKEKLVNDFNKYYDMFPSRESK